MLDRDGEKKRKKKKRKRKDTEVMGDREVVDDSGVNGDDATKMVVEPAQVEVTTPKKRKKRKSMQSED